MPQAIARGIIRVAALQEEARLLKRMLVEVVQELRVGSRGKFPGQATQVAQDRREAGLGIRRRHRGDRLFQVQQAVEDLLLQRSHPGPVAHPVGSANIPLHGPASAS